jgi:hypothetical protein
LGDLVKAVSDVIVLNFLFATEVAAVGEVVEVRVNGFAADTGFAEEVRRKAWKKEFALKGQNIDVWIKAVGSCGTCCRMEGFAHVCVCEGGKTGGDIGRCRLQE